LGEERVVLENLFGDIDDQAAKILGEIDADRSLANLTLENRGLLGIIAAAQLLRVRMRRTDLIHLVHQMREMMERFSSLQDDELDQISISESQARLSSILNLANLPKFATPFLDKDLILISSADHRFLVGDNPIALFNSFPYGDIALSAPGIEIYFPLSADLTLGFYCPTIRRHLEQLEAFGERKLQHYLDAIRTGNCVVFEASHVDFFNGLQVRQASRNLYSSTDDFARVRSYLEKLPQSARVESLVQTGIDGWAKRERMPLGTFIVAVGKTNHYMIPADITDNDPDDGELKFRTDVSALVEAAVADSPFRELSVFVDKLRHRMIRDVVFLVQEGGEVLVRCSDDAMQNLFLKIRRQ